MITVTLFIVLFCLLFSLGGKIVKRWRYLDNLKSVPGPARRSLLLGNLDIFQEEGKHLNDTIGQRLMGLAKLYQEEGIFKFFIGHKPIVCVFNPGAFRAILGAQIEKPDAVATLRHGLGNGLGTADGAIWRKNRKLLMPAFSTRVLNEYLPVFNHHANVLCDLIQKERIITDVEHVTVNTSLDLICETAMGVKPGSNCHESDLLITNRTKISEEDQVTYEMYAKSLQVFTEILVKRIFSPWLHLDVIFFKSSLGKKFKEQIKNMHSFTKRIIRQRSSEISESIKFDNPMKSSRQVAFLDLLLLMKKEGLMSEEGVRSEVDTFTFAGHDTVAVTIAFALFEIGNNPKVHEKLYQEIVEVFGSQCGENHFRDVSSIDLKKLVYLERVIKEVLRLYPPGPTVGRVLTSDVQIEEHLLPKGTEVWCLISALHMNPNVYLDPVRFNPERNMIFDNYSYAPFSAGIRNCIGHRFAMMALKVILASVIRRFKITSLGTRDKLLLNFELILRAKTKIEIKFDSR